MTPSTNNVLATTMVYHTFYTFYFSILKSMIIKWNTHARSCFICSTWLLDLGMGGGAEDVELGSEDLPEKKKKVPVTIRIQVGSLEIEHLFVCDSKDSKVI